MTMSKHLTLAILLAIGVAMASPAKAYNVFPFYGDPSHALKWGDNTVGSPGGVVTWSLMKDGTGLDATAPSYIHGTSNLSSILGSLDTAYGAGTALQLIQNAFDHWSAVANIQFVYVGEDDGTDFSAPYAPGQVIGDIRIGAFDIDGFSGAVGYAPPPNGSTTLEGDILFNLNVAYGVAPGAEGDQYYLYPWPSPTAPGTHDGWYHNDFEGLFAHELGHALGMAHSDVPSALMCGYVDANFDGGQCSYFDQAPYDGLVPINRIPDADDIAGIRYLYGAAPVPEPQYYALWAAGLGLLALRLKGRTRA